MLAIADRGFFSFEVLKLSIGAGAEQLWRMKANAVLPVHEELADGSYLPTIYEGTKARRNNTDPIPVRAIEYTVTTGKETGDFRLITSILDPAVAPARDLAEAYAQRWEIEQCFNELKTHQCGPSLVLRSKTPDGVMKEIYGYLCVHYASRWLIGEVARDLEETPLRISFTRTLRAARRSLARRPAFPLKSTRKPSSCSAGKFSMSCCRCAGNAATRVKSNARCRAGPSNGSRRNLSKRYYS